ncbi:hypothetical protein [Mesorhizobium sp. 113-3-3]|uniref:hypothetical protein n=1 Tax=Mesorhizobium sp. 113-3-3 TaxID=2744516 RepID=UPI001927641E|nr:hypothetical protein [Mesorhizobium sp. 113-3-3]BCG80100.1 hypothetical protein MesoLj113b_36420 [Mesorhizobium sp. 113-3-3]
MNQHVNRRTVFANSAAAAAAAVAVMPFDEAKAGVVPAATELAVTRVNRLTRELSLAMDDWMTDLGDEPDAWVAHVYPSKSRFQSGFQSRHNLGGWHPDEKIFALEAAFHEEWRTLRTMEPALNEAEKNYWAFRVQRPVMGEMTDEEIKRLHATPVGDLANLPPSRASIEHAAALRAYEKADAAAKRKSGFGKLERAYTKQMNITADAAGAVLREPAKCIAGLAAKERVHRVWEFDGEDFKHIMADIATLAD